MFETVSTCAECLTWLQRVGLTRVRVTLLARGDDCHCVVLATKDIWHPTLLAVRPAAGWLAIFHCHCGGIEFRPGRAGPWHHSNVREAVHEAGHSSRGAGLWNKWSEKSRVNFIVPWGKFAMGIVLPFIASHKQIKTASQEHIITNTYNKHGLHLTWQYKIVRKFKVQDKKLSARKGAECLIACVFTACCHLHQLHHYCLFHDWLVAQILCGLVLFHTSYLHCCSVHASHPIFSCTVRSPNQ